MQKSLMKYRRVYGLLRDTYWRDWHVKASFALALLSRACKFVALPIASSQIIASLAEQDYGRAQLMVMVFVGFSTAIAVLSPLTKYVALLGENFLYGQIVADYFNSLLNKDAKYFNESMTGYLTTALRQYGDGLITLSRKIREKYLTTFFSMVVPIVVIGFINLKLGLLVLVLSSVQGIYILWLSHRMELFRTKAREIYRKNSGIMSDAITNIVAVKSMAQEQKLSDKLVVSMREENLIHLEKYKVQAKLIVYREIITVLFFFALFWVTVEAMRHGAIDIASAMLVVTYSFTILTAIYSLSDDLEEHDEMIDKIAPVFDLYDNPNKILDPAHPAKLGQAKGAIEFKNVSFAYEESGVSVPVIADFNLDIPAGQKLGIVGLSGAGKSTLAKLLLRFEDAQRGEIRLDGHSVRDFRQADLRRNIGYVPQEPLLFHASIAENIRLAKLDATDVEVEEAARRAHALGFINALPSGLNSIVGERGVKLSGGQKQRVAIARALLQDAPIMLLDEATSALDSESEQIIKNSFAEILRGKTAIVIAHRLSTLSEMDRIILLHNGEVVEDGTHAQLVKSGGMYAKLWRQQRYHPEESELS